MVVSQWIGERLITCEWEEEEVGLGWCGGGVGQKGYIGRKRKSIINQ